jgi:hypothetical protein
MQAAFGLGVGERGEVDLAKWSYWIWVQTERAQRFEIKQRPEWKW